METSIDLIPEFNDELPSSDSIPSPTNAFDDPSDPATSPESYTSTNMSDGNLINTTLTLRREIEMLRNGIKNMCVEMEEEIHNLREQVGSEADVAEEQVLPEVKNEFKSNEDLISSKINSTNNPKITPPVDAFRCLDYFFSCGVSSFTQSTVLITMLNKITQNADVKAKWYFKEHVHSVQEKTDPIYSAILKLLGFAIMMNAELRLSDFLVSNMMTINCYIKQTSKYSLAHIVTSPCEETCFNASGEISTNLVEVKLSSSDIPIIANDQICNLKRFNDTLHNIWQEFFYSKNKNTSIRDLEKTYGTKWRKGEESYLSKAYGRRKPVYTFIVFGMKEKRMKAEEIIGWLDRYANDGGIVRKRATLTWFLKNQQNVSLELFKVCHLGKVDILNNY